MMPPPLRVPRAAQRAREARVRMIYMAMLARYAA